MQYIYKYPLNSIVCFIVSKISIIELLNIFKMVRNRTNLSYVSRRNRQIRSRSRSRLTSISQTGGIYFMSAFQYNCNYNYSAKLKLAIGEMTVRCIFCNALRYKKESKGICCSNGSVKLPELTELPEELKNLLHENSPFFKHFLDNVRYYNSCFQMTSFGAKIVSSSGYSTTFKIQGQIYHRIGSLIPNKDEEPSFLQIYFTGNNNLEIRRRCDLFEFLNREIVATLQAMLHVNNKYVRIFKSSLERMPTNEYRLLIRGDMVPVGEHERCFNAPTMDEVAVILVGEATSKRDIILHRRKQGEPVLSYPGVYKYSTIGRLYTVHPSNSECFFLRLLLTVVIGPTCFDDLKTVNGMICETYRAACEERRLLECDKFWSDTLVEVSFSGTTNQLRNIFAIIITTCFPSNPKALWERHKNDLAEDYLFRARQIDSEATYNDDIYNLALITIEDICISINGKLLQELGMNSPKRGDSEAILLKMDQELYYDPVVQETILNENISKLTEEQKIVFTIITDAIETNFGGLFFLDAPGGTGKTFLISLLLAHVRRRMKIALAMASSRIAQFP